MDTFHAGFECFCNSEFLSDCEITIAEQKFPAHKIVLAAYSNYFFTAIKNSSPLTIPELPKLRNGDKTIPQIFPDVLRFIYSGQNPQSIAESLDPTSAFPLLAISQALLISDLTDLVSRFIILDLLTPETCIELLCEALALNNSDIIKACEEIAIKSFTEILEKPESRTRLLSLPIKIIQNILKDNDLNVESEACVYNFVCWFIEQAEKSSKIEENLKSDLLGVVRWPHLSHSELLKAASNPISSICKDLILEGLSAQLSQHELADYKYTVSMTPRASFQKLPTSKSLTGFKSPTIHHRPPPTYQTTSTRFLPTKDKKQLEFTYSHDFDNNGVLYYLGTSGGQSKWQNPHLLGEIRAFCSSIGFGKIEEFVGRSSNSIRTANEEGSFIGVDLGPGRLFALTAYTLRNSSNVSHGLLNWQLEGSLDRSKWKVIDKRIHYVGNPEFDEKFEVERKVLMKRAGTSTWAVSSKHGAFRYFRIASVGRNLSGTYNLAFSCVEFYGTAVAGVWP